MEDEALQLKMDIEVKHLGCGGDFVISQHSGGDNGAGFISECEICKTRIAVSITTGEGGDVGNGN